jgi:hypothetical protein
VVGAVDKARVRKGRRSLLFLAALVFETLRSFRTRHAVTRQTGESNADQTSRAYFFLILNFCHVEEDEKKYYYTVWLLAILLLLAIVTLSSLIPV